MCGTALAAPADAAPRVFLPNCGNSAYGGRVEPGRWDAGCTGTWDLIHASWRGWGRDVAIARGFTTLPDCNPDCSTGTVSRFRARLRVSRVRTCRGKSGEYRRFYTRARLRYRIPADDPPGIGAGLHVVRFRLICDRLGPQASFASALGHLDMPVPDGGAGRGWL
jgi:hypothetical protein